MSSMPAMPVTTVQKMIGAITILISLMKPSPSGLIQSFVANSAQTADHDPKQDRDQDLFPDKGCDRWALCLPGRKPKVRRERSHSLTDGCA